MSLTGNRLGPYDVLAPLGAGGMGEVYRARDTKLGREVALKVLPAALGHDPDRLARFQREAQVLASLNHPNIAIIHGLEDSGATPALVLELVEGPTLAERLEGGPLPIDEAIRVARQIALALAAAHQHGIVHRDLKPANVKITPAGVVKVLDFGLAKLVEAGDRGVRLQPDFTASPTITSPALMTGVGMILGTAAYMAPEQARGQAVDKRADVWAFGCVVFEMLTGKRPFDGRDVADTLAAVLKLEPDWHALPVNTSATLRRLLRRTLAKEPEQRLHDIADARLDLEEALSEPAADVSMGRRGTTGRTMGALAVSVAVTALLSGSVVWWWFQPAPPVVRRLAITFDREKPLGTTNDPGVAVSPDGSRIVYVTGSQAGQTSFMLRALDQLNAIPIEGTARGHSPIFSPDGEWVAFFADSDSTLKKVPVGGGPVVTITKAASPHLGASWGSDGTIIFAGPGLSRVSAAGGAPAVVTAPDRQRNEIRHGFPDILPNNRGVLFAVVAEGTARIEVLRFDTGERQVVVDNANGARYVSTGHVVYSQGGRLFALPFDQDEFRPTGQPVPVLDGVAGTADGPAVFAVARDGSLVYLPGILGEIAQRTLVWIDKTGREEPLPAQPRPYQSVRVSPDGVRLVMEIDDPASPTNSDLWIHDLRRNTQTRLTFTPGVERAPLWSPDGKRILFSASGTDLFVKSADGIGGAERLAGELSFPTPYAWSADGRVLLTMGLPPDIYALSLGGNAKPEPIIQTPFNDTRPAVSPDGRWIAYQSNESGRNEVYVQPFPDFKSGRWQISTNGGDSPAWSPDGRQLHYRPPGPFMSLAAVPIDSRGPFIAGLPSVLFDDRPYLAFTEGRAWDVAPDGRFLMLRERSNQANASDHLVVVQSWIEELKRLVPAP